MLPCSQKDLEARKENSRAEVWDASLRVKLGGCLIGILLGHLMIKDRTGRTKFAVEHDYLHNMDKTVLGVLRAQDAVIDMLKSDTKLSSFVNTRQLPMIVKPVLVKLCLLCVSYKPPSHYPNMDFETM
eukprot:SAG11_NODE_2374_length_3444_cov_2.210762_2_plen_128_part_00